MKRILIVLALVLAMSLVFVGAAYANFGPHGGYASDTDACAGCHRAHTSFSTVGWKDNLGTDHASALLVGNATTMTEFCEACHGDTAPGASTNVASGVFDSGPSGASGINIGAGSGTIASGLPTGPAGDSGSVVVAYQTASTFNAPLNGGGFNRMPDYYAYMGLDGNSMNTVSYVAATSAHKMDVDGPLWGGANAVSTYGGTVGLTCTDCHDPHGSSNYRLLKATVNNINVGGYDANNNPTPLVFSDEQGYPIPTSGITNGGGGVQDPVNDPNGGWLKHAAGAAQMALYRPNYTDTTGTPLLHTKVTPGTSISAWCAACHIGYNQSSAGDPVAGNYNPYLPNPTENPSDPQVGPQDFHRHAVDITLAQGAPNPGNPNESVGALTEPVKQDAGFVPLEQNGANAGNWWDNYMGCLTCHRAHGSSVSMTGYAAAHLAITQVTTDGVNYHSVYAPVRDGIAGVDPDKGVYGTTNTGNGNGSSALLRADNRGVCERCHNK